MLLPWLRLLIRRRLAKRTRRLSGFASRSRWCRASSVGCWDGMRHPSRLRACARRLIRSRLNPASPVSARSFLPTCSRFVSCRWQDVKHRRRAVEGSSSVSSTPPPPPLVLVSPPCSSRRRLPARRLTVQRTTATQVMRAAGAACESVAAPTGLQYCGGAFVKLAGIAHVQMQCRRALRAVREATAAHNGATFSHVACAVRLVPGKRVVKWVRRGAR